MMPSLLTKLSKFITCLLILAAVNNASSDPLRVGSSIWPGYEPLYLAEEIDAYQADVRMIHYPSASEVLRAFKNKALEVAALTLDEAATLEAAGIPINIILVCDISNGADVIMARPEIKNMEGLIGAKIAVESTAVGAYTLSRALEIKQMSINQVRPFNVESNGHTHAYKTLQADAVVTYEPYRTQLLNLGAIEIFNSAQIPGEIVDVLVVHREYMDSHEEALSNLLTGWFTALKFMNSKPSKAYQFIGSRMKITPKEAQNSYQGLTLPSLSDNHTLLSGSPSPLMSSLQRLSKHMKDSGLIRPSFNASPITNSQFLPSTK